jgi:primosomal protein N' (replication factor Y)
MRMSRLARRERAQLLVEAGARPVLQAFLRGGMEALYRQRKAHGLRWQLDVDPLEV